MRDADTILTTVQKRGTTGLPLLHVYRMLYCKELYLRAYAKLYANAGALTPGSTPETVDGMTEAKIDTIIAALRAERYHWKPARRTYIPKANGKRRSLGLPTWSDKLLQEVIRTLLEAYYEPQFSQHSHGFRPHRGCHTALSTIQRTWNGTRWFIEGDIAHCFDTIDHDVLLTIIGERIHDNRFLGLIRRLLQGGYLEDWRHHRTYSGTPQGGVLSPLLANIYLDRLDRYITTVLIPMYTRGDYRRKNPPYARLTGDIQRARASGQRKRATALRKQRHQLPSVDPRDPNYRRLRYLRYADDFILGFAGPRAEAEDIKQHIATFLHQELRLTLSLEKTHITHATNDAARFLGYDIVSQHDNTQCVNGRRTINGCIGLRVPKEKIQAYCARYLQHGNPIHRMELVPESDYAIISRYQQEYRGIVQYYILAYDVSRLNRLRWTMQTSLLKTLACKHRSSVSKMYAQFRTTCQLPDGSTLVCMETRVNREGKPPLIARFGGIPLRRNKEAVVRDTFPKPINNQRSELLQRVQARTCELCGATHQVEVHHIRKLADLRKKGRKERPAWQTLMIARQRKTLVVCRPCHQAIHQGTIDRRLTGLGISWNTLLESRVR